MKIMVNKEARELDDVVFMNGPQWTHDLLLVYDALHTDRGTREYTMTENEFDWWQGVIGKLDRIQSLKEGLNDENRIKYDLKFDYYTMSMPFDDETPDFLSRSDLASEINKRLDWLEKCVEQERQRVQEKARKPKRPKCR